jgi:hypothetical protein
VRACVAIVISLCLMASAGIVFAAQGQEGSTTKPQVKAAPNVETITGTVNVTKSANGNVSRIDITTADKSVYRVILNNEGKTLATENGKLVEASGILSRHSAGNTKWMLLKNVKLAQPQTTQTTQ